jgi:nitrite reductase (NO-forming)
MVTESVAVSAPPAQAVKAQDWRYRLIGIVRIAFGLIWGFAAWLKWQPDFQNSFLDTVGSTKDGQPALAAGWISFWVHLVSANPLLFARVEASLETALAVALIFGIFSNLTDVVGFFLALGIWSTAEGFGGPYKLGQSTDIGTALPYALFFVLLFAVQAGRYYGLDRWLSPRLGRLKFLAN